MPTAGFSIFNCQLQDWLDAYSSTSVSCLCDADQVIYMDVFGAGHWEVQELSDSPPFSLIYLQEDQELYVELPDLETFTLNTLAIPDELELLGPSLSPDSQC